MSSKEKEITNIKLTNIKRRDTTREGKENTPQKKTYAQEVFREGKNDMITNKLGKPVSQRQLRVGEMIKQSLGMIFARNEAKVPNLETNNITVTEVKMSQDLKIAKAYVLPLGG